MTTNDEVYISRHRTVLRERDVSFGRVRFSREPDDQTDVPDIYELSYDTWIAMGEPDNITISVEPGDLLNTGLDN